jgi:hypothetical protein
MRTNLFDLAVANKMTIGAFWDLGQWVNDKIVPKGQELHVQTKLLPSFALMPTIR